MTSQEDDILNSVRGRVPGESLVGRMIKSGCRVKLDRLGRNRLIIDVDKIVPDGEGKCDYIFVNDGPLVAPIELKRGKISAEEARRQLQAGANIVDKLVIPMNLNSRLKPIAFSNGIGSRESALLKRSAYKIHYRGRTEEIKIARCGSSLKDAIR